MAESIYIESFIDIEDFHLFVLGINGLARRNCFLSLLSEMILEMRGSSELCPNFGDIILILQMLEVFV